MSRADLRSQGAMFQGLLEGLQIASLFFKRVRLCARLHRLLPWTPIEP